MRINLEKARHAREQILSQGKVLYRLGTPRQITGIRDIYYRYDIVDTDGSLVDGLRGFLWSDVEQWQRFKALRPDLTAADIPISITPIDQGYNERFPECWNYEEFAYELRVHNNLLELQQPAGLARQHLPWRVFTHTNATLTDMLTSLFAEA